MSALLPLSESPVETAEVLWQAHCRNQELTEWRILAIRQSIPAIRDRAVIEAKSAAVKVIDSGPSAAAKIA
jgi:hypothetical protein